MRLYFLSFIGIAINLWVDVAGGGSPVPPGDALRDAQGVILTDAQGQNLESVA